MIESLLKLWRKFNFSKNLQLRIMRTINAQFLVGVTGVIFNNNNEVLLFKHSYRSIAWSLPGGYMKGKEHPKEALEREIKEESNFTVSIDWRMKIRTDRQTSRLDIPYIGTFIGDSFKPSAEVIEFGFFSLDNLPHIRTDQLFLINKALEERKIFFSTKKLAPIEKAKKSEIANL